MRRRQNRTVAKALIGSDQRPPVSLTPRRNATSLTQIVEDVLDISRIVSGKIRLNVQPTDLPDIVRNAIDAITPAADAKGVRIEAVLDPQAAPVSGDPERLQQVLWNLLSNAVKFTNRGGKVQVRLERVDSSSIRPEAKPIDPAELVTTIAALAKPFAAAKPDDPLPPPIG